MKKVTTYALASTLVTTALLTFAPQALALELHVDDRGMVSFFEDGVLGETSDQPAPVRARQATKVAPAARDKRVEIKAKEEVLQVKVSDVPTVDAAMAAESGEIDAMEAKRLRAQFNTKRLNSDLKESELATRPAKRPLTEAEKEYRVKLNQERRQNEDALEVQSQLDAQGDQELELQNNAVRARLQGADFSFNPETNTVTLITPSGQEHELNHLPDQALERINGVVMLQNTDPATPDVTIEATEDGTVYRNRGTRRKKLFGLFNREVQTEVVLDDETGEVITTDQPTPGILGKLLDAFSI